MSPILQRVLRDAERDRTAWVRLLLAAALLAWLVAMGTGWLGDNLGG